MRWSYRTRLAASSAIAAVLIGGAISGVTARAQAAPVVVTIPSPGNPAISTLEPSLWGGQILIDQGTVMEGLYGYNDKNQIVPKIATGYKVSGGGKVWTFYLRHDARWSNGKPVTAQDFYYAWMRVLSPQNSTAAVWASVAQYAVNAWQYHAGAALASQVGIKVLNPYAIQLRLTAPHDILGDMVLTGSMPLYRPSVEAHPTDWYKPQYFVSDAPYTIKSFVPNGQITLVRNPHYVGNPKEVNVGNVQQINVIPGPTVPAVPVEDYLANKFDVALISYASDYHYVQTHPALKSQMHVQPAESLVYLQVDKSVKPSPVDNPLVRKAVALALDRAPIVTAVLNGMAGVATGFGPPSWPPVKNEHSYAYNVTAARALLTKAGYPNGKGIPTLAIYAPTTPNGLATVPVAEAVAQELKQGLNINTKIYPTANTLWGQITWGGLNPGIEPGFNIATGVVNWIDPVNLTMQANQLAIFEGTMGPPAYRTYISHWYFDKYDPVSVARYGNPDDKTRGTTWADMLKLQKAVIADDKYLTAWRAQQPALYRELLTPAPGSSTMELWNNLVKGWKAAKTPADKHTAWATAWKFVGNYSAGNGGANVGLDGQVYVDEHQPHDQYLLKLWNSELGAATSAEQENALAAKIVNLLTDEGFVTPIAYVQNIFLAKPWVHDVVTNPFSWGNFYQLQYLKTG
jgi:ABC-type oligopeptide transport system substrate-binding subunit